MCIVDRGDIKGSITPVYKAIEDPEKLLAEEEAKKNIEDALSIATYYTKLVLFGLAERWDKIQQSQFYKLLLKTTQPAHLVTILAVSIVAFLFYPGKPQSETSPSILLTFCYLATYGIHLGSQVWMTFVSGLSLYFSLPRHIFGKVQKVLFPLYFLINSVFSFITIVTFMKMNNFDLSNNYLMMQGTALTFCFLIELVIRLYLAPPLISVYAEKIAMEEANGVGMEVGKNDPGKLVHCPHYLKIHKNFRKIHMAISIGNMLCMASSIFHLHYLANKLSI